MLPISSKAMMQAKADATAGSRRRAMAGTLAIIGLLK
jgi:hypothetical protein